MIVSKANDSRKEQFMINFHNIRPGQSHLGIDRQKTPYYSFGPNYFPDSLVYVAKTPKNLQNLNNQVALSSTPIPTSPLPLLKKVTKRVESVKVHTAMLLVVFENVAKYESIKDLDELKYFTAEERSKVDFYIVFRDFYAEKLFLFVKYGKQVDSTSSACYQYDEVLANRRCERLKIVDILDLIGIMNSIMDNNWKKYQEMLEENETELFYIGVVHENNGNRHPHHAYDMSICRDWVSKCRLRVCGNRRVSESDFKIDYKTLYPVANSLKSRTTPKASQEELSIPKLKEYQHEQLPINTVEILTKKICLLEDKIDSIRMFVNTKMKGGDWI
jgi:hypothetical protein